MKNSGSFVMLFGKYRGKTLDEIADETTFTRNAIESFVFLNSSQFESDE